MIVSLKYRGCPNAFLAYFIMALFQFICCISLMHSLNGSPVHDRWDQNEIENEIDISHLGKSAYILPDKESGKNVQAWTINSVVNPEEMSNYFEGDIRMPSSLARNGLRDQSYRWKDGVIPYEISGHFASTDLDLINKAIRIYQKYTCIRFVPRQASDEDYVAITNKNTGCWSSVGRITGRQELNLQSPSCTTLLGTALHEMMHTAGFYHEQNRPERDDFVTVNFQHIKPGHDTNFLKADRNKTEDFGVIYDYNSVMHYSDHAFSKNGHPTINPKVPEAAKKMGQRKGFSGGDIRKLNGMYNCKNTLPELTTEPTPISSGNNGGSNGGQNLLSAFFNLFEE